MRSITRFLINSISSILFSKYKDSRKSGIITLHFSQQHNEDGQQTSSTIIGTASDEGNTQKIDNCGEDIDDNKSVNSVHKYYGWVVVAAYFMLTLQCSSIMFSWYAYSNTSFLITTYTSEPQATNILFFSVCLSVYASEP